MSFFDLFKEKPKKDVKKETVSSFRNDKVEKAEKHYGIAMKACNEAELKYTEDGDINALISVYEKYFTEQPGWNAFNFHFKLAKLYIKAGRNDDAWAYLNKMVYWSYSPETIYMNVTKIRKEQFKILKKEKKFEDAMVMLIMSHVDDAYNDPKKAYFNKKKFFTEGKTTAKKLGLNEEQWLAMVDAVESAIIAKHLQEKDVKTFYTKQMESMGTN